MSQITMPALSDSMEEGTVLRWLLGDGDTVAVGDELLEVETDKATMTVAAEVPGVLRILVEEGTTVSVGTVIAEAAEVGSSPAESPPGADEAALAPADGGADRGSPRADPAPAAAPAAATPATATPATAAARAPAPASAEANGHAGLPASTPLARRAAREHGVDLHGLSGSGPRGRITRGDVLAAVGIEPPARAAEPLGASASAGASAGAGAPARASRPAASAPGEPVTLSRTQRLIARRMSESRTAIPEFEVQTDVVMDRALALRAEIREQGPAGAAVPSLNDLVLRATALALTDHPALNASWVDDRPLRHPDVHLGVAVAREDALVVPVIRGADALSLGALSAEARRLAEAVRTGTVSAEELSGATFTVSNLGMFGMTAIRPIINAPQVGILGVGAVRETVALENGEAVARRLMTVTLSCDHRAVYGADAARFLSDVRDRLEAPLRLLV